MGQGEKPWGKYGHTPLMHAVRSNNPELVRFLADHGANIDQVSNDGHTALFYARFDKNKPITDVLLNAGAKSEGPGEAWTSDFKAQK
jgi:ankyrin repeat protein